MRFSRHTGIAPEGVKRPDIPERWGNSVLGRFGRGARGAIRCRRGAYAVEFALLVPVFVPILMGSIELAWQFGGATALDHAALEASRFGALGRKNADGSRSGSTCEAAIKDAAIRAGSGLLVADRLTVRPRQFNSAATLRTSTAATGGTAGTGVGGSFVEYRLEYRQRFIVAGTLFGKTEQVHVATTTVVNEPYPDATNPPPC